MSRSLKAYIAGVVIISAFALVIATLIYQPKPAIAIPLPGVDPATEFAKVAGVGFWVILALVCWALPVKLPFGTHIGVAAAPMLAAMFLGGPAVAGWVAMLGTTERRELRREIPWYGSLANHAGIALPAIVAGVLLELMPGANAGTFVEFLRSMIASVVFWILNITLAGSLLALRTNQSLRVVMIGDSRGMSLNTLALGPIGWLMSVVYTFQWWATLLFALPLYTTRQAAARFVEMRDMFTQTIGALAEAVDKRDPYTARHSQRVKEISVDIGRVMRVSDSELEALEWGGLLHDVGKIGVPDAVLLKQDRLNREERMIMNSHPVLGAQIIAPVTKLAAELPIIRHHHEWYNGSGYPDRLIGDEIPKLARILHVADAFEAMTAARPYRMTPLTSEQALAELRKFAGVQFDPIMVDAFVKTAHVDGVPDAGRPEGPRQIPLLAQAADRMTAARAEAQAVAPPERA